MSIQSLSYKEALQYLHNLEKLGVRLGLERIKSILKAIGNPQDQLRIIHIGGTNGKGSTSAMMASVLQMAGYKVGLYTSPHLVRFNERIRINGKEITDRKVAELVERIRNSSYWSVVSSQKNKIRYNVSLLTLATRHSPLLSPTFFEFTTAMAFLYFAEEKVDFAVMEVGLGGRLDATNVGKPIVSIITNVSKDHEAMLGNRITDIAFEKAGIIKENGILISAETKPVALKVFGDVCKKKKSKFYRLHRDFFIDESQKQETKSKKQKVGKYKFKGRLWIYHNLTLNLLGKHQHLNAACALAALEVLEEHGYNIPESAVRDGLRNVFWPGRFEVLSKTPFVILDCAHNPAGAEVLKEALLEFGVRSLKFGVKNQKYGISNPHSAFRTPHLILVFGIMADKDIKGVLSELVPLAHAVILTRPKTDRAASLDVLYRKIIELRIKSFNHKSKVVLVGDVAGACKTALSKSRDSDIVCATGSVFTVGEAREFLLKTEMRKNRNEK